MVPLLTVDNRRSSAVEALWPSGQSLRFRLLKLRFGEHALIAQGGESGDLVSRAAGGGDLLDILPHGLVLGFGISHGPILHLVASGDEVDQDSEERQNDDDDGPQSLAPSGQVIASEDIAEDDH